MITIRSARETDLPAILDIYNHVILNTTAIYQYQPQTLETRKVWFDSKGKDGYPIFVAEEKRPGHWTQFIWPLPCLGRL